MFHLKKSTLLDTISGIQPQYFCLAAALGLEFLLMAFRGYGFYFMENYMIVPTMLFLGTIFGHKISRVAQRQLWLCLGFFFWFFIAQTLHYMMDLEVRSVGLFTSVYLLAFPFASLTQDGKKQWGLKLTSVACIGAALILVALSCLMMLDVLPGFLKPHIYWDGARLQAFWHPNICAVIFLMGIAFSLYCFTQSSRKWCKTLFIAIVIILFFFMTLTNSRTSLFLCSCMFGGLLFFRIYNGSWKRFLIGTVVALVVILLLFNSAQAVFQAHYDARLAKFVAQAEEMAAQGIPSSEDSPITLDYKGDLALKTDAGQLSLAINMPSLNGRTNLWAAGIQALMNNPTALVLGVDTPENFLTEHWGTSIAHSHNSWLDTLIGLGIPGLLFALIFTGIAVWHIWTTCWGKNCSLDQKIIAMLLLCLMGTGFLEPYLFFTTIFYHYTDFIFFLCLGYLILWRSEKNV